MFILSFVCFVFFFQNHIWYALFERRCSTLVCNTKVFNVSCRYILCMIQCDVLFPRTKLKNMSDELGCSVNGIHCGPLSTLHEWLSIHNPNSSIWLLNGRPNLSFLFSSMKDMTAPEDVLRFLAPLLENDVKAIRGRCSFQPWTRKAGAVNESK